MLVFKVWDISSYSIWVAVEGKRTPPRFRALIWSIVLSALRDADCVNDLVWHRVLFGTASAGLCGVLKHLNASRGAVCVATVFELLEANVRRAMRGAAVDSSDLARPAASLLEEDMIVVLYVRSFARCWLSDVVRQFVDGKCFWPGALACTDSHDLTMSASRTGAIHFHHNTFIFIHVCNAVPI